MVIWRNLPTAIKTVTALTACKELAETGYQLRWSWATDPVLILRKNVSATLIPLFSNRLWSVQQR